MMSESLRWICTVCINSTSTHPKQANRREFVDLVYGWRVNVFWNDGGVVSVNLKKLDQEDNGDPRSKIGVMKFPTTDAADLWLAPLGVGTLANLDDPGVEGLLREQAKALLSLAPTDRQEIEKSMLVRRAEREQHWAEQASLFANAIRQRR